MFVGVPWNKILACIRGRGGRRLILKAEQFTRKYDFYYTPTILFNHVIMLFEYHSFDENI